MVGGKMPLILDGDWRGLNTDLEWLCRQVVVGDCLPSCPRALPRVLFLEILDCEGLHL